MIQMKKECNYNRRVIIGTEESSTVLVGINQEFFVIMLVYNSDYGLMKNVKVTTAYTLEN